MNHDNQQCFFNNREEEKFLFSLLNDSIDVLEWGSGASTVSIATRANWIHSIEHNKQWYDHVRLMLPGNARLHYITRNKEEAKGHDGTEQDYYNYVHYPETLGKKFDIILVDGRARVACAKIAIGLLKPGGSILIHDIFNPDAKCDRPEYWEVLNFLHPVRGVYALWQFEPKRNYGK